MKFLKHYTFIFIAFITLTSCNETTYKFKLDTTKKTILGEKATISFQQLKGNTIDSLHMYINGKRIDFNNNTKNINTSDLGVGTHSVTALAFYPNKVKKINNSFEVLANVSPIIYDYKIINEYTHDKKSFTQGLEFKNGFLYETTGRRGQSKLRKINYRTGEVLLEKKLDSLYFGEGMTIFKDNLFWLTWQAGKGFIYNLNDFKQTGEFSYNKSIQGWGLTHNETELIKSDGTNKIWFLNPENQKELRAIQVYTNKVSLKSLNELEWANGKIYANYWQKPLIAIINPNNGVVEGIINLKSLVEKMQKTQALEPTDDVLNGIAYNPETKTFFVTGKHWSKLFEVEFVKQ